MSPDSHVEFAMKITLASALIALTALPSICMAEAGNNYHCVIERVSLIEGDTTSIYEVTDRYYVGKEFTVDRATGLMEGTLKNSYITKPTIVDPGSAESGYKVMGTLTKEESSGGRTNIFALTILENITGEQKPFVFLHNEAVFFGLCKHV